MEVAELTMNADEDIVYIIIKHGNGFHMFEFYPATSSFSTAMKSTTLDVHFITMMNG
jgi:hypothetical protein